MKKRFQIVRCFAAVLAFILAFTTVPVYALAEEPFAPENQQETAGSVEFEEADTEEMEEEPSEEESEDDSWEEESSEEGAEENSEEAASEEDAMEEEETSGEEEGTEDKTAPEEPLEEGLSPERNGEGVPKEVTIELEDIKDKAILQYAVESLDTNKDGKLTYQYTLTDGGPIPGEGEQYDDFWKVYYLDLGFYMDEGEIANFDDLKLFGDMIGYLDIGRQKVSAPLDLSANTQLVSLDLRYTGISNLDNITFFSKDRIIRLDVSGNPISSLDLRGFPNLEIFGCEDIGLADFTKITFPAENRIWRLVLSNNELTGLDLSSFTELEDLECDYNKISDFNQIKFPSTSEAKLTCLNISGNEMQGVDVSRFKKLESLCCSFNAIGTLDVSVFPSLTRLECNGTGLTSLDISRNVKLTSLDCAGNELEVLNTGKNTKLEYLNCNYNQLKSLNLGSNTRLADFSCAGNRLKTLDVSKNTALAYFYCGENLLQTLNVANNKELVCLFCNENELTGLNLKNNKKLEILNCTGNRLKELDVSFCPKLLELYGNDNYLAYVTMAKDTKLEDGCFATSGNGYPITADMDGNIDLSKIPGFNPGNVVGKMRMDINNQELPIVNGKMVTIPSDYFGCDITLLYQYQCNEGTTGSFELKVQYSKVKITLDPGEGQFSGKKAGETKDIFVTVGKAYSGLITPSCKGYNFDGWYGCHPITGAEIRISTADMVENARMVYLYAKWSPIDMDFEVTLLSDRSKTTYNGTPIKPEILVRNTESGEELVEGVDYTVSYGNNVNANVINRDKDSNILYDKNGNIVWMNPKKIPTITVTGKGNYSGKKNVYFEIQPESLKWAYERGDLTVDDPIYIKYNGKNQTLNPVLKYKGKTLKKGTDYDILLAKWDAEENDGQGGYVSVYELKEKGEYIFAMEGMGNFLSGINESLYSKDNFNDRPFYVFITDYKLMSKLSYTIKAPKFGEEVPQDIIIKDGGRILKGQKKENYGQAYNASQSTEKGEFQYYYVIDKPDWDAGTVRIVFYGAIANGYDGIVMKTVKLTKRKLTAGNINLSLIDPATKESIKSIPYDYFNYYCPAVTVTWPKEGEISRDCYEVKYTPVSAYKVGSVKVTVTGKKYYYGEVVKTFKVTPFKVDKDKVNKAGYSITADIPESAIYSKGGARFKDEDIVIKCNKEDSTGSYSYTLKQGVDYKVQYSNNGTVNVYEDTNGDGVKDWTNPKKVPKVTITFMGNYSGTYVKEFQVKKKTIHYVYDDRVNSTVELSARDIAFNKKPGKFTTKVTVTDLESSKQLTNNTDYTVAYYLGGKSLEEIQNNNIEPLAKNAQLTENTQMTVVITGKGNYGGSASFVYEVKSAILDNASISLAPGVKKYYTGKDVTLAPDELVVKVGGKRLEYGRDYTIHADGYVNNSKAGTASVTVTGINEYGGSKTIKFTINKRTVSIPKFLLGRD